MRFGCAWLADGLRCLVFGRQAGHHAKQLDIENNNPHQIVEVVGNARSQFRRLGREPFLALQMFLRFPLAGDIAQYKHPAFGGGASHQGAGQGLEDVRLLADFVPASVGGRGEYRSSRLRLPKRTTDRPPGSPPDRPDNSFSGVGLHQTHALVQQQYPIGHAAQKLVDLLGVGFGLLVEGAAADRAQPDWPQW